MTPEEEKEFEAAIWNTLDNFEESIIQLLQESLPQTPEVIQAWHDFLAALGKTGQTAHIIVEPPKFRFTLFPTGTGEPKVFIGRRDKDSARPSPFTVQDKKAFKDLGLSLNGEP